MLKRTAVFKTMLKKLTNQNKYHLLINNIGQILEQGRKQSFVIVNQILVKIYWNIGRLIIEYEQAGKQKAEYGSKLFERIAKDLKKRYGKGFSRSNIIYMRLFYKKYPKSQTVSDQLSWSHYVQIISLDDNLVRSFYEKQCLKEKWSVRELSRQISSMLFERIALSKDKAGILQLSKKGQIIQEDADVIKDPYILEFLKIPENYKHTEKELEQKIIDNLQIFLLELGKGFAFVGRQFRISFKNRHFYIDLVFYHRILKCFVLIDLKTDQANHLDVGQMNMYLNYFKKEENNKDDNQPIGLILAADKDNVLVEYALGGISNKLFVSKYKLYLPDRKRLADRVKKLLEEK